MEWLGFYQIFRAGVGGWIEGIFIAFGRGRVLNSRVKFPGGIGVRVGFFRRGLC